jgi:hypothetical protein
MNTKQQNVTVEEAPIEERTVTIRVLTVGSKQITQALYRQLPDRYIIDRKTGQLRGTPWGWINVHEPACKGSAPSHLHVVWELDGLLLRASEPDSALTTSHFQELARQRREEAGDYLRAVILERGALVGDARVADAARTHHVEVRSKNSIVTVEELPEEARLVQSGQGNYYPRGVAEPAHEYLMHSLVGVSDGDDPVVRVRRSDEIARAMDELTVSMASLRDAWERTYKQLLQLSQLFIAVSGVWK